MPEALRRVLVRMPLRARLSIVLVGALLLLLVLSIGAVGWSRGHGARHLVNDLVAADALRVRTQLARLPADERAAGLSALDRAGYRWQLVEPGSTLTPDDDGRLLDLARRVASEPGAGAVRPVAWRGLPALRLGIDDRHDLLVVLPEGLPASTPAASVALGYLAGVTLLVAGVAWLAVAAVTRPLADAAQAARAMALNLASPPLSEAGPPEIAGLAGALNAMQSEVRRQLESRTRMLAAVSHDLKTPITRMRLRTASLPEGETRRRIEDDLDAMSALVDEGLAYARSERLHEPRCPVDLNALLENIVEQALDTGQDCRYAPRPLGSVMAAPRALARLVQNLVDNAIRYGGRAEIEVERDGVQVELRVADRGPDLPQADLEHLFEPFVRGESSRGRDTGGTGLGLAIARNIAQAHGGRLWLEPRAGGGLVARLQLPNATGST